MRKILIIALSAIYISGCTSVDNFRTINRDLLQRQVDAQAQMAAMKNAGTERPRETVRYLSDQFVSLTPILQKVNNAAPSSPLLRCRISIETVAPISMLEFAQTITRKCKVNVRVTPDALAAVQNPLANEGTAAATNTPMAPPMQPQPMGAQTGLGNAGQIGLLDLNYHGELSGLMDTVTSRWGVSWKVEDGKIKIYNVDTRVFLLSAFNSDTTLKSDVQSGTTMVNGTSAAGAGASGSGGAGTSTAGGIGGSTGSQQSTTVTLKMELWKDIMETVKGMKSPKGTVVGAPSTGTITVTDNEDVLSRMERYVTPLNARLEKQVVFDVDLVSVETNDTDALGLSFNALFQTLNQKYGFSLASSFSAPTAAASGTFSILKNSGSRWSGTDAIVSALSEQGNVGLRRAPSATTLNLQTVSVQVARQKGFVAGSTTTNTAQVGSTTTLQTGMVTTGLNMSLTPYVFEDNRMLVAFSINLSSLLNIRAVSRGDTYAELPELNLPINMSQKVRLASGDTMMLSGFDDEDTNATQTGTFTPSNWLLGGGINGTKRKTKLLVLITPRVMQ
ncbi:PilN family type IVB pilus formation outer membrane protein [Cupriavidus sp. D39]|uniref:PilN family type IVB pilus formation outer membrane protein n=1 Tax=Cupriavidus sp. D39 TaxID=2997877 RepID=UPI00226F0698|nr:PilN family type IVB pilus formation outer membrane protein [Cupriavidus sp. D39]MCY0853023.1 PilN family type IVB pilus formation outer membrane protein [Cupriavidus sp. D39]